MLQHDVIPSGIAYITLTYKCKKCHNEHWVSHTEAQTPGFRFVCAYCKAVNIIAHVRVKCLVSKVKQGVVNKPRKNVNKNVDSKAQKIICGYGYTKKDAIHLINKAKRHLQNTNQPDTQENIIKSAFSLIENC